MPDRLTDTQWAELRKRMDEMADGRLGVSSMNSSALAGYLLMLMDRIDGLEQRLEEVENPEPPHHSSCKCGSCP